MATHRIIIQRIHGFSFVRFALVLHRYLESSAHRPCVIHGHLELLPRLQWTERAYTGSSQREASNERKYASSRRADDESGARRVRRAKAGRSEISTKPAVSCQKI